MNNILVMGIKKISGGDVSSPERSKALFQLDREWWESAEKILSGDMQWSFEEARVTRSYDFSFLKAVAVNRVVMDGKDGFEEDGLFPVYLLETVSGAGNEVVQVVTSVPSSDEDFAEEVKRRWPWAELIRVDKGQKLMNVYEDQTMRKIRKFRDKIGEALDGLCELAYRAEYREDESGREAVRLDYPVKIRGVLYGGIDCHTGRDGDLYYRFLRKDGGERSVGMHKDRLLEFVIQDVEFDIGAMYELSSSLKSSLDNLFVGRNRSVDLSRLKL